MFILMVVMKTLMNSDPIEKVPWALRKATRYNADPSAEKAFAKPTIIIIRFVHYLHYKVDRIINFSYHRNPM